MNRRQRARKQERREQHLVTAKGKKQLIAELEQTLPSKTKDEIKAVASEYNVTLGTKLTKQAMVDQIIMQLKRVPV